jgi:hypothetical protein
MSAMLPAFRAHASPSRDGGGIRGALGSFLRLLWVEVRRSQGNWLLPLMVLLGIVGAFERIQDGVVLWRAMSFATLRSYAIIGPLAAALAAWLMGRDRRRRLEGLVDTLPGDGFQRDLLAMLVAAFWGITGYAVVGLWFGWKAMTQATWGGPDIGLLLTGALAIVVFAGIGTLVGRFIPGSFAAILALGLTFLLTIGSDAIKQTTTHSIPNSEFHSYSAEQPLKLLMPWGLTTYNYKHEVFSPIAFVHESLLWHFALLAVVVVAVALTRKRGLATYGALALSLALAVVTATPLIQQNPQTSMAEGVAFEWTCESASGIEVCLHPAYSVNLDETLVLHEAVIAPIAGLEGVPVRWVQAGPRMAGFDPADGMIGGFGTSQAWNLAEQVFPATPPTMSETGEGPAIHHSVRSASQVVILYWLMGQVPESFPGMEPSLDGANDPSMWMFAFDPAEASGEEIVAAIDRFSALTPEEQRAWLEENWTALRAGDLTLSDMP